MGEDPDFVYNVGCPRIDYVQEVLAHYKNKPLTVNDLKNIKVLVSYLILKSLFLIVSQHPVTTEFDQARLQIEQTLKALQHLKMNTVMLWPNSDAGSDQVSKGIRTFSEAQNPDWLYLVKNIELEDYIRLLNQTSCIVGNSSSALREGAFIGVPSVNVGTRQHQRLRAANVIDVSCEVSAIEEAIQKQVAHGPYAQDSLYGQGKAAHKIIDILISSDVCIQKTITY